jgi:hypothetical protein
MSRPRPSTFNYLGLKRSFSEIFGEIFHAEHQLNPTSLDDRTIWKGGSGARVETQSWCLPFIPQDWSKPGRRILDVQIGLKRIGEHVFEFV